MVDRIKRPVAELLQDGKPLPQVGQVQFSGEEMAILTLGVGIMASILAQDKRQIKEGTAILVGERDAILPVLTSIITKLTMADDAMPFLAPEDVT